MTLKEEMKEMRKEAITKQKLSSIIKCARFYLNTKNHNKIKMQIDAIGIILENNKAGTGINGIIYAAPIADAIALILILILTIYFFKDLKKTELESR